MSIGNLNGSYQHIIVSPTSLKPKVLSLMDEEIKKGTNGRIIMKMNSVTDVRFYPEGFRGIKCRGEGGFDRPWDLLYSSGSQRVHRESPCDSIVGRYLEHPRIFLFWNRSGSENLYRFCRYDDA